MRHLLRSGCDANLRITLDDKRRHDELGLVEVGENCINASTPPDFMPVNQDPVGFIDDEAVGCAFATEYDPLGTPFGQEAAGPEAVRKTMVVAKGFERLDLAPRDLVREKRSEEHTSELQSLMSHSSAGF